MHILNGVKRNFEIAAILDIDQNRVVADLAYRTKSLIAVMNEYVKTFLNFFPSAILKLKRVNSNAGSARSVA